MRHCSTAVHKSKELSKGIARGQSTSNLILQAEDKRYDKTFTARVITSNSSAAGESTNWRADYHKFKGSTFAQVVKSKSSRTHKLQKVSNQIPNIKNTKTGVTPVRVQVPVLTVSKSNNNAKTCKQYRSTGKPHTIKVSATNEQIVCHNRFASIYPGDDFVLCAPGDNEAVISIPQKNAANSDHAPTNQATKPSLTDAQVQHVASLDQLSQTSLAKGNVLAGGAASEYTNTILPDTHCPEITSLKGQNDTFKRVENVNPDPRNVSTISDHKESLDTKYDLPLKIKQRINYKSKLSTCSTLRHWDSQNKFKFGYIPLGDLHLPPEINSQTLDIDPLSLHKIIKQSGNFNFLKAQITVSSQLKPDVWDMLLQDYWDKQLCSLIRFGFPLDFDRNISLESHLENHFSAKAYPQDI